MNDEEQVVNTVAPITNVRLLTELVERAKSAQVGLPKMAVFYGFSGLGKSVASIFAANAHDSYSVEMRASYTPKKLLAKICAEMSLSDKGSAGDLVDRIGEHLARPRGRNREQPSLILDEADVIVRRGAIEYVRDIYESSGAAVILIGEEKLPKELEKFERVHGRVMDWVGAQPVSRQDAKHLSKIYCAGVEIGDELFEEIMRNSGGSARRLSTNLNKVREFAKKRNMKSIDIGDCVTFSFSDGIAPAPRRGMQRGAA